LTSDPRFDLHLHVGLDFARGGGRLDQVAALHVHRGGAWIFAVTALPGVAADRGRGHQQNEYIAALLERDLSYVVVAEGPVRSRWVFFLMPDTLPYRLAAIVLVTGW
jgi:hypothetical protein